MFRLKYEEMIEWIPNKIFGSNTGSFDCSADQTASGYVNTPINNHIITTLGFSPKKKWKILESRELKETRRCWGWRRRWQWWYRWRRRCKRTPLRGRGPMCLDMLQCLTFRSDLIWFDLLLYTKICKCDLISESFCLCLLPPSWFPISSLWDGQWRKFFSNWH